MVQVVHQYDQAVQFNFSLKISGLKNFLRNGDRQVKVVFQKLPELFRFIMNNTDFSQLDDFLALPNYSEQFEKSNRQRIGFAGWKNEQINRLNERLRYKLNLNMLTIVRSKIVQNQAHLFIDKIFQQMKKNKENHKNLCWIWGE
jgi:hypothetical protein